MQLILMILTQILFEEWCTNSTIKVSFPQKKVLTAYQQKVNSYKGSKVSMWRILKSLHFKYKKFNDDRRFLMERNDIVAMRVRFLRKMHDLRQNNDTRPVVYLDET